MKPPRTGGHRKTHITSNTHGKRAISISPQVHGYECTQFQGLRWQLPLAACWRHPSTSSIYITLILLHVSNVVRFANIRDVQFTQPCDTLACENGYRNLGTRAHQVIPMQRQIFIRRASVCIHMEGKTLTQSSERICTVETAPIL